MQSDHFEKIKSLYFEYQDLDEGQRADFLSNLNDSNSSLYTELISLIEEENQVGSILKQPAVITLFENALSTMKGRSIEKYLVGELIEEGGMGAVYHATRNDGEFEQEVAIKFIRPSVNQEDFSNKFRYERQILAKLQHPNIVRLLDGGKTDDNILYFTMEYVDGLPLDKYIEKKHLGNKEKLNLFKQICKAVEYAHRNLVLHLDLKPANILVTSDGLVKILDFGIAQKLLGHQQNVETDNNARYSLAFAAPELIKGQDVNTQSDVFSLSSILFFLFNNSLPFGRIDDSIKDYKAKINSNSVKLNEAINNVPKDIVTIYAKGLSFVGAERYQSVSSLNNDINRHIKNLPISLKRKDLGYRFNKFLIRNKWTTLIGSLAGIALVISTLYYTNSLKKQRDIALDESEKSTALSNLMQEVLQSANPYSTQADTMSIGETIDNAVPYIREQLKDKPELKAEMLLILCDVYHGLQKVDQEDTLLMEINTILKSFPENKTLLGGMHYSRSNVYYYQGDYVKAELYADSALSYYDMIDYRPGQIELIRQKSYLGLEMNDFEKSDSMLSSVYDNYRDILEESPEINADFIHTMGMIKMNKKEYDIAEDYLNQSLAIKNEIYEAPHTEIAYTLNYLSSLNYRQQIYDKALSFGLESYSQRKDVLGIANRETLAAASNVGRINLAMGNAKEALAMYHIILHNFKKELGLDHLYVAYTFNSINRCYRAIGDASKALIYCDSVRLVFDNVPTPNLQGEALLEEQYGLNYKELGETTKAKEYFTKTLDYFEKVEGADHAKVVEMKEAIQKLN